MTRADIEALQLAAFAAVAREDLDYQYRRVMRWYAEQYGVAPHAVEDLPPDHVWQTYWEVQYEEMRQKPGNAFGQEGALLIRTAAQIEADDRAERLRQAAAPADADDFATRVAAEEARKALAGAGEAVSKGLAGLERVVRALPPLDFSLDDDVLAGNLPR